MTVRYVRSPAALSRRVGRTWLLASATAEVRELNDSASAVWDALEEPVSVAELAGRLGTAFGIEVEVIEDDVSDCVASLLQDGLVVPVDE